MSEAVEVREADERDVAALSLIGAATFLETFAGMLDGQAIIAHCMSRHGDDYYRKALRSGCRAFLAEAIPGRAPVGFALVGNPDLPVAEDGDLELKRIYLLSRYQGGGTGSALMQKAIDAAAGYRRLLLGVFEGNGQAQAFYKRKGFEPIGKRAFDVGGVPYEDTIYAKTIVA